MVCGVCYAPLLYRHLSRNPLTASPQLQEIVRRTDDLPLLRTCFKPPTHKVSDTAIVLDLGEDRFHGYMLLKWWDEVITQGLSKWNRFKVINPLDNEPVIDKTRYSAFPGTSLDEILKYRKIEDLINTGVMTNCCCETTARDAFMKDYRVFFVSMRQLR
jgi:nicotinamidase-related amidase